MEHPISLNRSASPFSSTTLSDKSVFDMVWQTFESGLSQQVLSFEKKLMHQMDAEDSMMKIVSELDIFQIQNLLDALQSALSLELPSSVSFALFLNFKCKILDCLMQIWPLERLSEFLYTLHPMECVCTRSIQR